MQHTAYHAVAAYAPLRRCVPGSTRPVTSGEVRIIGADESRVDCTSKETGQRHADLARPTPVLLTLSLSEKKSSALFTIVANRSHTVAAISNHGQCDANEMVLSTTLWAQNQLFWTDNDDDLQIAV